jgi:nucleoside-diphosphate-sugar epimerase
MNKATRILVTGAGGFIGHHLVHRLKAEGHWVRGVDIKHPEYQSSAADEFEVRDLRKWDECLMATRGEIDEVITSQQTWGASVTSLRTMPILHATTF